MTFQDLVSIIKENKREVKRLVFSLFILATLLFIADVTYVRKQSLITSVKGQLNEYDKTHTLLTAKAIKGIARGGFIEIDYITEQDGVIIEREPQDMVRVADTPQNRQVLGHLHESNTQAILVLAPDDLELQYIYALTQHREAPYESIYTLKDGSLEQTQTQTTSELFRLYVVYSLSLLALLLYLAYYSYKFYKV